MSPSDLPSQMQFSSQCPTAIAGDLTTLLTDIGNPAQLTDLINTLKDALGSGATPDQLIEALQALGLGSLLPGAGTSTTSSAATTTTAATTSDGGLLSDLDLSGLDTTTSDRTTTFEARTTTPASTTTSSAAPDPSADLSQLVTDFFTFCIPAPPSGGLPTSSSAAASPVGQEEQPQPQAQPVTTQPVTYPGYAGTGGLATTALRPASDQRPSPAVPLAVLGGVLLAGSAATAAGVRSRARRHGR